MAIILELHQDFNIIEKQPPVMFHYSAPGFAGAIIVSEW